VVDIPQVKVGEVIVKTRRFATYILLFLSTVNNLLDYPGLYILQFVF